MLTTRFTELIGCTVPIQQAGMGGIATPELAAAVADAGALGMVAVPAAPAPVVADVLAGLRARTAGAFGINFLMPFLDRDAVAAAADKVTLVEFFYDEPDASLVEMVHAGGALAGWQVGSVEEAKKAVTAGCDLVIAQGTEAGGHVRGSIGLLALLADVLDAIEVPVVAAGGISTPRALAAVLAAGADGARVGTLFVAAAEADAHPAYVDALIAAHGEDTVLTEAFSVMWPNAPHRVLRSCVDKAATFDGEVVGEVQMADQRMPLPRHAVVCPGRTTTGEIEAMALYAGQSVGDVTALKAAADIVRELADGAEALLGSW